MEAWKNSKKKYQKLVLCTAIFYEWFQGNLAKDAVFTAGYAANVSLHLIWTLHHDTVGLKSVLWKRETRKRWLVSVVWFLSLYIWSPSASDCSEWGPIAISKNCAIWTLQYVVFSLYKTDYDIYNFWMLDEFHASCLVRFSRLSGLTC